MENLIKFVALSSNSHFHRHWGFSTENVLGYHTFISRITLHSVSVRRYSALSLVAAYRDQGPFLNNILSLSALLLRSLFSKASSINTWETGKLIHFFFLGRSCPHTKTIPFTGTPYCRLSSSLSPGKVNARRLPWIVQLLLLLVLPFEADVCLFRHPSASFLDQIQLLARYRTSLIDTWVHIPCRLHVDNNKSILGMIKFLWSKLFVLVIKVCELIRIEDLCKVMSLCYSLEVIGGAPCILKQMTE